MSATIIPFGPRPTSDLGIAHFEQLAVDADNLVRDFATPDEWLTSALFHLKGATSGRDGGAVEVSVAALHLVLEHLERLEIAAGIIPDPAT